MKTMVQIFTSFIKDISLSSTAGFFLPGQHLTAKISWAFFTF